MNGEKKILMVQKRWIGLVCGKTSFLLDVSIMIRDNETIDAFLVKQ